MSDRLIVLRYVGRSTGQNVIDDPTTPGYGRTRCGTEVTVQNSQKIVSKSDFCAEFINGHQIRLRLTVETISPEFELNIAEFGLAV